MIYKKDFRYSIGQHIVRLGFRSNFHKIVYTGLENIPDDCPVIYAPNHRNAILDGLSIVNKSRKQVVFLARADIFKKKFISWVLTGVKVAPIYRIRDGKDNLSKNEEVFDNCHKILKNGNPLCLFPEAKHNPRQSLLPIQKGIPRIALPTEALADFKLNTNIIPVSLYYTDKSGFLSDLFVDFGKPLKVDDYKQIYEENPNLAINTLRHDLDTQLRSQMVDISNDSYYPFYIYAIDFWGDEVARKQYPKEKDAIVKAAKQIVKELDVLYEEDNPKFIETVDDLGRAYSILRLHGMTSKDNVKKPVTAFRLAGRFLCLLLTFPLALSGFVNTIIGIVLYRLLRKKVKDQQFIASIRVLSAIFIVPILYILQTIVFGIISGSWAYTLLYLFVSPVIFYFACYWRKWFKAATRAGKIRRFARKYKEEWLFVNKLTDKKE